jgi:hypothetical protein
VLEAQGAVKHVLLRRDDTEDGVCLREVGVGEQLEARRRGGERGEDEQRALEVGLGGGGSTAGARGARGAARGEKELREAEPCPGLGEREERGGVGRAQRGLEAGCRGRKVAAALRLGGQCEETLRARRRR